MNWSRANVTLQFPTSDHSRDYSRLDEVILKMRARDAYAYTDNTKRGFM